MKDNLTYLKHILESIEKIENYIQGFNLDTFPSDSKTVDAVIRQLEIIGEAANNLSKDFQNNHPEIPCRNMIDMRNVVIHEYLGVNLKTVWTTCQTDLPPLREKISTILLNSS